MQQHSHYLRVILALQILLPVASALTPSFGQQACSFKGVDLAAIRGRAEALDRAHMYMYVWFNPFLLVFFSGFTAGCLPPFCGGLI